MADQVVNACDIRLFGLVPSFRLDLVRMHVTIFVYSGDVHHAIDFFEVLQVACVRLISEFPAGKCSLLFVVGPAVNDLSGTVCVV